MRLVILESPYAGHTEEEIQRNIEYARRCVRDSLMRGEAPIASHLLYTQTGILRDENPDERNQGITAGLAWINAAEGTVVYTDLGVSAGMWQGISLARVAGKQVLYRAIGIHKNSCHNRTCPNCSGDLCHDVGGTEGCTTRQIEMREEQCLNRHNIPYTPVPWMNKRGNLG